MKYKIVEETSRERMQWDVERRIADGWKPIGGISVYKPYDSIYPVFLQAITRSMGHE